MFRISAPQLKVYMDRQSQGAPASGVTEHICGRCGKKYFSALSISGNCKTCGVPLCKACIENDNVIDQQTEKKIYSYPLYVPIGDMNKKVK